MSGYQSYHGQQNEGYHAKENNKFIRNWCQEWHCIFIGATYRDNKLWVPYHLSHLQIDDQIALLINAWCELLVFSCCYRSINSPGLVRVSNEKSLSLASARHFGIDKCVDKMLNFTEQLRRLKVDHYEYVSMKVIVLLTSGTNPNEFGFSIDSFIMLC